MFLIKKPSGIFHYKDSECIILHREDGPAIERTNGDKEWFLNGIRHRENGPAIEHPDGYKVWYFNGKCHRQNGPAIEHSNGYKEWRINGKYHREDGPAVEYANGAKEWYLNGKELTKKEFEMRNLHIVKNSEGTFYYKDPEHRIFHREDGPAIEYVNGRKEWHINGKLHREDGPAIEYADGDKEWYLNGKLHRKDGPAVEYNDGSKEWFLNGYRHRMNGPAVEYADGYKAWYLNGKRHRTDGPAVEYTNGNKAWFLNGKLLTKKEFDMRNLHIVKNNTGTYYYKDPDHKILHREDGPAVEYANGTKEWCLNGKLHREDGPAVEWANGAKEWYLNGKLHREDGPAVEYANGAKEWYLNGKQLTKEEFEMRNLHIVKNSEGTFYYKDPEHTILHREDGPAAQYTNGDKRWYLNGKLHREDGPAIEFANGEKQWYLNGERHRKDGPAVEVANKTKHWYLNGQLHREDGPAIERSNGDKEWWLDGQKIISFNIQKIKNMKNKDSGENMPTEKAPAFEKFFKDLSDDGMVDDALFNKEVDLLLNDLKKFNLNNSDSLLSDLERALRSDLEKALQSNLKKQLLDDIETVKQPVISNEKKSTNQSGSKSFMNKLTVSGFNGQGTREFIIGDTVKVLATVPIKNSNEENKYFPNVWGNLEFEAERLVFLETIRMLGGQVKSEFIDAKIKGHSIYNDHIQIEWNQNGKIVESFLHKDSIYKNLSEVPEHIHRLIEAEKIFKRTLFTKGQQAWVAIFHLNDADKINQSAFKSQKELLDFVVSKNGYFEIVPATIEEILPLEQVKISFKNGENKDTLIANELNVFFTYEEANKHWGEYVSESLFALTGFSKNQKLKYFSGGKIQEGELEKISASKNMPTFCWFKTENGLVAVPEEDVFHLNEKTPPHIMKRIPFSNKLKMDLGNAGYRIAATQLTNLARKTIVSLLAKQINDESKLGKFTKMLDTEMGGAVVAGMVGLLLLKYYPANPKAQKLAEELRITSMATIGNEIVDTFIQELLPGLVEAFSSLPETEKKRIVEEVNQETSNIFLEEKNALKEEMIHAI